MSRKKYIKNLPSPIIAHLNELLDEALQETFPASDPVAVNVEIETFEPVDTTAEERGISAGGAFKVRQVG